VHAHGPHARPRAGPPRRWVYEEKEEKVDGWRFWPTWDGERVRLVSRNGVDHTRRFRDIAANLEAVGRHARARRRGCDLRPAAPLAVPSGCAIPDPDAVATPPLYMAFDLLYRDGRALSARPLPSSPRPAGGTPSPAAGWSSRCGAWRRTAWRRGLERSTEAHTIWLLAEVATASEPLDVAAAPAQYGASFTLASGLGMRPLVAHDHLGLGKLHLRMGKHQEAKEHLATATAM
jgi:hypothetical protein